MTMVIAGTAAIAISPFEASAKSVGYPTLNCSSCICSNWRRIRITVQCSSGEVSVSEPSTAENSKIQNESTATETSTSTATATTGTSSWVPVVPIAALPKGERRLVRQEDQTILLLWYKNEVFAIENKSPAEGAYSEGLLNARLTPDGCVVCPTTGSTFDLRSGEIKEWYPSNVVMRLLLKPTKKLSVYPVKLDSEFIYISLEESSSESAEVIIGKRTAAGNTTSEINIEEVRMVLDENSKVGFGFTAENEISNGRAAMMGFSFLLLYELTTGKGFLNGTGFLGFIYQYLKGFPVS